MRESKIFKGVDLDTLTRKKPKWNDYAAPAPRSFTPQLSSQQLAPLTQNSIFKKRARAKWVSFQLAGALAEVTTDATMKRRYLNTLSCSSEIIQRGDKLTSKYCGNRWCVVCNRIRTGKLINKYLTLSEQLSDSHFVTLTVRNIKADLSTELDKLETMRAVRWMQRKMFKHFRRVQDLLRKYGVRVKGIRSYEVIPTKEADGIRPHIHWKIDGNIEVKTLERIWKNQKLSPGKFADLLCMWEAGKISLGYMKGELIVQLWLKEFKDIADRKGQDVRKCTEGNEMELFKYETKFQVRNKNKQNVVPLKLLDIIYQATQKVRAIQVTGFITKKPKLPQGIEVDELERYQDQLNEYNLYRSFVGALDQNINEGLEAETIEVDEQTSVDAVYVWSSDNWYSLDNCQRLISFEPNKAMASFIESFHYG